MAELYEKQEKYDDAERMYERALRILERVHGAESGAAADTLNIMRVL
jgi:tetratricopeptide (TPR) repeat protein